MAGPAAGAPRAGVRRSLAALLLFSALAAFHTWPLASAPGTLSRHDNTDAVLNEWAVAWVAHQLPRNPLKLFDANIFHPEPNTLAFSEHLFVQSIMGAPLLWAGVPTVLVHNLLILAGFALTGWAMCMVLWRWTGDWYAAVLGGMLLAFNAHSLTRIAHLQAVHVEFLPFALLALDRLLIQRTLRSALLLSAMFVLQSLTSNYLLVFMTFGMTAAALSRAREWAAPGRVRALALLCASGVIAIALLLPFLWPYMEARRDQGLSRSLGEVTHYSAAWQDYLSASGRIHYSLWSAPLWRGAGAALFPGVTALGLVFALVLSGPAWRSRVPRMWMALGVAGLLLSFGTSIPGYEFLYQTVPLLQGIRASVRFGYLVLAAVAALAAFGLVVAREKLATRPRVRTAVSVGAVLLVTVESARLPVGYSPAHQTPGVYRVLATQPVGALVELPLYSPAAFSRNGIYMLHATEHWKPLLNGYSGFIPASYRRHADVLRTFPDRASLDYLRTLGVSHVVVHESLFVEVRGAELFAQIERTPALRVEVEAGNTIVYRLLEAEHR